MRQTNRNQILELLEEDSISKGEGLTTLQISTYLKMQRTNVSKLLNELVSDGYAIKSESKHPVIYKRSDYDFKKKETEYFKDIIGWDSSLKQAIHLAKAAIMYPNKSLNILLLAPSGSGKSMFVRKLYDYAVNQNVLSQDAAFIKLNCFHYLNDYTMIGNKFKAGLEAAENGFFYIDNCNLLDSESKNTLSSILDEGYIEKDGKRKNYKTVIVCSLSNTGSVDSFFDNIKRKFSIVIQFPSLDERTLEERFQFIKMFLSNEAEKSSCLIKTNSEVLIALLLYNCKNNIKQLKNDIRQACASAYIRKLDSKEKYIELKINDFAYYVRSGLLNYKNRRKEIDIIIQDNSNYIFDGQELSVTGSKDKDKDYSIYEWIDNKSKELQRRGLSDAEINTIVNVGIESEFNKYRQKLATSIVNKDQLSMLVDSKILSLVDKLLKDAAQKLNRLYPASIYYGLCLHLQSLIDERQISHTIKIERIMQIVEDNKDEYTIANNFCEELSKEYDITLDIDEIVLITMFLCEKESENSYIDHPSVLIAMHGDQIAKAMAETAKALNDIPVYYFDMPLNRKIMEAYEDLKSTILSIPHEKGVLVIYDMGSLKDMLNMLMMETGIHIKMIEIPFTMMLLDCCRKVNLSENLDEAYETLVDRYKNINIIEDRNENESKSKAIVSICMTGEGGAIQIKKYLENNYKLNDIEVIALQLNKQSDFMIELNKISKERDIMCIIGPFNPNVFGIPFIPVEAIFNSSNELSDLLNMNEKEQLDFINNVNIIFEHLSLELKNVSSDLLKRDLLDFIRNLEKEYAHTIEMNEKIGMLIHLACAIDKLKEGHVASKNPITKEIINRNMLLYRLLSKYLYPLENDFDIQFNDDEIANLICIIKKSKNG